MLPNLLRPRPRDSGLFLSGSAFEFAARFSRPRGRRTRFPTTTFLHVAFKPQLLRPRRQWQMDQLSKPSVPSDVEECGRYHDKTDIRLALSN